MSSEHTLEKGIYKVVSLKFLLIWDFTLVIIPSIFVSSYTCGSMFTYLWSFDSQSSSGGGQVDAVISHFSEESKSQSAL